MFRTATTRVSPSLVVIGVLALWAGAASGGQPAAGSMATEALALCVDVEQAPASERPAVLARGLTLAEEAVRIDPYDATAHFAVFCNLGKRLKMESSAHRLFHGLDDLRRAQRAIDRTLELAPEYAAALAAKGQLLIELPRLLGGDPDEGERLIQRAAALDPADAEIRQMLSDVLRANGKDENAVAYAAAGTSTTETR